jgi:ABC-type lipoprotein export system ATPase subunit
MTSVLEMRDVCRSFETPGGAVRVLQHVNMSLKPRDFAVLTGPSGSGKTTLTHLATLMDHPTSGAILFRGRDIKALSEEQRAELRKNHIGIVFQRFHLLLGRSVLDNVRFRFRYVAGVPEIEATARAREALRVVGLNHLADRPARVLSAGEMQRVAIARAIAMPPDLLVADEPTGNLDLAATMNVMDCFARLNRDMGITILLVTHNEALLSFATRRLVCRDGAILEGGSGRA